MMKLFGQFVASILAILIASSVLVSYGQSQSAVVSERDEAEILESLLQKEIKPFGSEFGNIRTFSSDNIGSVSATRIEKQGFSLMASGDIQRFSSDHVIEYLVIRSIYRRDGFVVVRLSAVTEGQPCFARAFSIERSFTYTFQKSAKEWVARLVKRPAPFTLSRKFGDHTVKPTAKPNNGLQLTAR
jgi:hypothetical protein